MRACLFDLDGVLTQTAKVHSAAWKQVFDEYLRRRAEETGADFTPFDAVRDYDEYVDGKPRYEGVRSFLASRGIELPAGSTSDPPDSETIDGLGNRKNEVVLRMIRERGVEPFEGSVRYVRAVREAIGPNIKLGVDANGGWAPAIHAPGLGVNVDAATLSSMCSQSQEFRVG